LDMCASTLYNLAVLESEYLGPSQDERDKRAITVQDNTENRILKELNNLEQTYVDTRELSSYIANERAKVRLQMTKAAQLLSNMEIHYANLLTHDKEIQDAQGVAFEQSLQVLFAGAEIYNHYYNRYLNTLE